MCFHALIKCQGHRFVISDLVAIISLDNNELLKIYLKHSAAHYKALIHYNDFNSADSIAASSIQSLHFKHSFPMCSAHWNLTPTLAQCYSQRIALEFAWNFSFTECMNAFYNQGVFLLWRSLSSVSLAGNYSLLRLASLKMQLHRLSV